MKVYVETNPETIYSGRVKDEVKTTEIRMWFETDEEIEVLSLADYTKQVRAESEADKKALICDYESRITKHQELMSWLEHNNDELKQQLDEKDKEISNLNGLVRERDKQIKNLKINKKRVIEHKNKTKISFALEQLEKVKEKLLEELQNVTDLLDPLEYEDYHELIGCGRGYKNSIEEIDNQIKEIKGDAEE